ncbi:MAG: O-antigen ligase family protein [Candidatus Roizmanbacteria bacterium]|nr:O-antigen ligase family protein [Candidatus Roizmanbacteria bacterium]
MQMVSVQIERNRYFGEWLDEISIVIAFYYIVMTHSWGRRVFHVSIIFLLTLITVLSNWRTKTIIYFYSLVSSLVLYFSSIKRKYLLLLTIFFIIGCVAIADNFALELQKSSSIDRLIFGGDEEIQTVQSRYDMWNQAIIMGNNTFPIGVGLGNYYENLPQVMQLQLVSSPLNRPGSFILIDDPHNIFLSIYAQAGMFGLTTFILLVLYYVINDIQSFFKSFVEHKIVIALFWGIFLFSLFNPWLYFSYIGYFFFLRGAVDSLRQKAYR